jgi:single-strand DNA-binding protein
MSSLNKVFLMGNLTRDPELKHLPSGTTVASFGLAINRSFKAKDGSTKEEVCFVDVSSYGPAATPIATHMAKGRQVLVEGRLQYRTWETEGVKHSKHEIVADRVTFLGRPNGNGAAKVEAEVEEEVPF